MKSKKHIRRIIDLYVKSDLPKGLQDEVLSWLASDIHSDEKDQVLEDIFDRIETRPDRHTYAALKTVRKQTAAGERVIHKRVGQIRHSLAFRVAAAVAPILFAAGAAWMYFGRETTQPSRQITLQEVSITAPAGIQRMADLPDGSHVEVAAGSNLHYSYDAEGNRTVHLSGEALFKVAKDSLHPFTVQTPHLKVTVLGTEFRIDAREGSDYTSVYLLEGSVRVETSAQQTIIKPGDRFTYYHISDLVELVETGESETVAQVSSPLEFNSASLEEIFNRLEQVYGVTIVTHGAMPLGGSHVVRFPAGEDIDQVLRVLAAMDGGFTYTIDNKTVTIHKK